jgi:hypothetical protein
VEVALQRFENRQAHHAIDLTPTIVAEKVRTYPYGFGATAINSESSAKEIRAQIHHSLTSGTLDPETWIGAGL